jgi:NADH:ubiquinone oxidoreductase subunit B-like Fe-S oxidoreductase
MLTPRTSRLLDIQGFDTVDVQELARVAPWLRLAFGLCTLLGGMLTFVALLVSTTDICIPSMIYRSISGWPPARDAQQEG